ncbi:MAG: TspO/MBR family protein [Clostridia bacterium]|nr:TspO/MBR family protein [Clostridia bacterium]
MKIQWKSLLWNLALPLLTGGLAALLTAHSMKQFEQLNQPFFAPPGWLFPVVWTILYLLMGVSAYLVSTADSPYRLTALRLYGIQLAVNFFWPILFFRMQAFLGAFFWLLLLWILILAMIVLFYRVKPKAAYLQIFYLLWVTFAGCLNLAIAILN